MAGNKAAKLLVEGKELELPILTPTAGRSVEDIHVLNGDADVFA